MIFLDSHRARLSNLHLGIILGDNDVWEDDNIVWKSNGFWGGQCGLGRPFGLGKEEEMGSLHGTSQVVKITEETRLSQ